MRFLCDEMLAGLARLLRAAGYDTYLASHGEPDTALLHVSGEEGRMLLTRDRKLAERAEPTSVLIHGLGVTAEARSLAAALPIEWDYAPFTRCVVDNAPLREATPEQMARAPASAREGEGAFRACPACGRVYWPGSHVKRMSDRLAGLAQLPP